MSELTSRQDFEAIHIHIRNVQSDFKTALSDVKRDLQLDFTNLDSKVERLMTGDVKQMYADIAVLKFKCGVIGALAAAVTEIVFKGIEYLQHIVPVAVH